jgi:antitoxin (DNA-binding transcriptional repressor) of toxin-antitoxin stability system
MRGFLFLMAAALAGGGIGLAQTLWHFGVLNASMRTVAVDFPAEGHDDYWTLPDDGRRPRIVFDEGEEHDFGVMEYDVTLRRAFTLKNAGDYPLVIAKADSSCTCTLANIAEDAIGPDQTAQVELEWTARWSPTAGNRFRHWAKLQTNDPDRPLVTLTVQGDLTAPIVAAPPTVTFTRLAKSQTATAQLRLYCYRDLRNSPSTESGMQVIRSELLNAQTENVFVITPRGESPHDVAAKRAKSGCLVDVTVRPGLPLGAFRQVIRLHTNVPDVEPLEVPIVGEIGPDVRLVGRDYNERTSVLRLGTFNPAKGTTRELEMLIFGARDSSTEPKLIRIEPTALQVSLAGPIYDAALGARRIKVKLVIPPGAVTQNDLSKPGIVEIDTGHSDIPRLTVHIHLGGM